MATTEVTERDGRNPYITGLGYIALFLLVGSLVISGIASAQGDSHDTSYGYYVASGVVGIIWLAVKAIAWQIVDVNRNEPARRR